MIYRANEVAAKIHAYLALHPSFGGYTQGQNRWGQNNGKTITYKYMGFEFELNAGDFDCASSVVYAWQKALEPTIYKGVLGYEGYDSNYVWQSWYTGNMLELFLESGLFYREPMSFIAQTGDVYLNEGLHTAMCQTATPDVLSEFLINEHGGIIGGQLGDQTGKESLVRPYYDFPWDLIMHYNGKADFEVEHMKAVDVWSYKNPGLTNIDAYAHLLEIHTTVNNTLKEVVNLERQVSELTRQVKELKDNK